MCLESRWMVMFLSRETTYDHHATRYDGGELNWLFI